jgi:FKBP-type peptidyl-prolyl cis-trans isomerase
MQKKQTLRLTSKSCARVLASAVSTLNQVGLNLGVAAMRKGEAARLRVAPEYGFGAKGSFSFPSVPPDAELFYDVELLEFEPVKEVQCATRTCR